MAACRLRIFPTPDDDQLSRPAIEQEAMVPVRMHELIAVLRQAIKSNYVWLRDFQDDEVRVTQDFYDVIRAFSSLRPSA